MTEGINLHIKKDKMDSFTKHTKRYLTMLIEEKAGIEMETSIEVEGASGLNMMSVGVVVEHILIASHREQEAIRRMLVKIDFHNASVLDYFKHLAKALAR